MKNIKNVIIALLGIGSSISMYKEMTEERQIQEAMRLSLLEQNPNELKPSIESIKNPDQLIPILEELANFEVFKHILQILIEQNIYPDHTNEFVAMAFDLEERETENMPHFVEQIKSIAKEKRDAQHLPAQRPAASSSSFAVANPRPIAPVVANPINIVQPTETELEQAIKECAIPFQCHMSPETKNNTIRAFMRKFCLTPDGKEVRSDINPIYKVHIHTIHRLSKMLTIPNEGMARELQRLQDLLYNNSKFKEGTREFMPGKQFYVQ